MKWLKSLTIMTSVRMKLSWRFCKLPPCSLVWDLCSDDLRAHSFQKSFNPVWTQKITQKSVFFHDTRNFNVSTSRDFMIFRCTICRVEAKLSAEVFFPLYTPLENRWLYLTCKYINVLREHRKFWLHNSLVALALDTITVRKVTTCRSQSWLWFQELFTARSYIHPQFSILVSTNTLQDKSIMTSTCNVKVGQIWDTIECIKLGRKETL